MRPNNISLLTWLIETKEFAWANKSNIQKINRKASSKKIVMNLMKMIQCLILEDWAEKIKNINLINRNAEIAGLQNSYTRNKPEIFISAWSLLLKHGFEQINLFKIYGGAINFTNYDALRYLFNFQKEGIRSSHVFKNGEYVDIILFSVFNNSVKYPRLW
jgi:hypothetical protein